MAKQQRKEVAAGTSPTQILAEYISGLSYRNIPTRWSRTLSSASSILWAVLSLALPCPGEKSLLRLRRRWEKEKERSSGVMARRFPAPAPRWPTARLFTALKWMTCTALASFTPARKPYRPQTR